MFLVLISQIITLRKGNDDFNEKLTKEFNIRLCISSFTNKEDISVSFQFKQEININFLYLSGGKYKLWAMRKSILVHNLI